MKLYSNNFEALHPLLYTGLQVCQVVVMAFLDLAIDHHEKLLLDRGTPQIRPRSTAGAESQADNPVFDGIISLLPVLNEVFDYDLDPARDEVVDEADLCKKKSI